MSQVYTDPEKIYTNDPRWHDLVVQAKSQMHGRDIATPEGLPPGGSFGLKGCPRNDGTFLYTLQYKLKLNAENNGRKRCYNIGAFITASPPRRNGRGRRAVVPTEDNVVIINRGTDNAYKMVVHLCPKGMPWPVHE